MIYWARRKKISSDSTVHCQKCIGVRCIVWFVSLDQSTLQRTWTIKWIPVATIGSQYNKVIVFDWLMCIYFNFNQLGGYLCNVYFKKVIKS